jgi:hypothetical protein
VREGRGTMCTPRAFINRHVETRCVCCGVSYRGDGLLPLVHVEAHLGLVEVGLLLAHVGRRLAGLVQPRLVQHHNNNRQRRKERGTLGAQGLKWRTII